MGEWKVEVVIVYQCPMNSEVRSSAESGQTGSVGNLRKEVHLTREVQCDCQTALMAHLRSENCGSEFTVKAVSMIAGVVRFPPGPHSCSGRNTGSV